MTNLNVNQFVNIARQNLDGQVRNSQQDENRLVNKGSLGQRLVDFVKNIGEKLGILRPDPTRNSRQMMAINDFTNALRKEYGDVTPFLAMKNIDLRGGLTGRIILQVTEEAKRLDGAQKNDAEQKENRLSDLKEQLGETGKFKDLDNLIGNLHDQIRSGYDNGHGSIIDVSFFKQSFNNSLDELVRDTGASKSDLIDLCLEELKGKGGVPPDLKTVFTRAREEARTSATTSSSANSTGGGGEKQELSA